MFKVKNKRTSFAFFGGGHQPYRGLRSYPIGPSVGPGYWKDAENIRYEAGAIALRGGETLDTAGPTNADACYGGTIIEQGGKVYAYTAVHITGDGATVVRLYLNQYTISSETWGGWLEVTAGAGKYGNTTMTATDRLFNFTHVPSRSSEPTVVVQNGKDSPRIILGTQSAVIEAVDAPLEAEGYSPIFGVQGFVDVTAAATATNSNGARFAAAATGSTTHWRWTFTTPTVNDTAELRLFSGSVSFVNSYQALFLLNVGSADGVIDSTKWELRDVSGNYYVIHDPENGINAVLRVETDRPGVWLYAFPIGEFSSSLTAVNGVRLTVKEATMGAGAILDMYAFVASGNVPGHSVYSLAFENPGTLTESAEVVLKNPVEGVSLSNVFGTISLPSALYDGPRNFPHSPVIYYTVKVPTFRPTTAQRGKGVAAINIYRSETPGATRKYVTRETVAAYSGGWAYSGSYASSAMVRYSDNLPDSYLDSERKAPDSFNSPVPKGGYAIYANDRLYVGSNLIEGKPVNYVWASDMREGFRFRPVSSIEEVFEGAGFTVNLEGGEAITGFFAASASFVGTSRVNVFTNKNLYSVGEGRALRLTAIGCMAGESIAEHLGQTYWFDPDRGIKKLGAYVSDVSRLSVHDKLTSATAAYKVSGACWRGRYYFAYSGGVLVWSEFLNDWESLDTPAVQPVAFVPWRVAGESFLKFFSPTGAIYSYDYGDDDDGDGIDLLLTSRTVVAHDRITFRTPSIVCTAVEDVTLGADFVCLTSNESQPSEFELGPNTDTGSGFVGRVARLTSTSGDPGVSSIGIALRVSGTLTGPFQISYLGIRDLGDEAGVGFEAGVMG